MSGYTVEEPNETPEYYNNDGTVNLPLATVSNYWDDYSVIQEKRFRKVLRQLSETWYSVFQQLSFIRDYGSISIDDSNFIMLRIHRLFIMEHKYKIDYYKTEHLNKLKNKNFIKKKINKLKNNKAKL